jgi:hypothetical protein
LRKQDELAAKRALHGLDEHERKVFLFCCAVSDLYCAIDDMEQALRDFDYMLQKVRQEPK